MAECGIISYFFIIEKYLYLPCCLEIVFDITNSYTSLVLVNVYPFYFYFFVICVFKVVFLQQHVIKFDQGFPGGLVVKNPPAMQETLV